MTTNLDDGLRSIGAQWHALMENANEDGGEQTLVQAGDVRMFDYSPRKIWNEI